MTAVLTDDVVEFFRPLNEGDEVQNSYSVWASEQMNVRRGVFWSTRILRAGKEVGTCWNDGDGMCNGYTFVTVEERSLFEETSRKAYVGVRGFEDEEGDAFIAWLDIKDTNYTPIGRN